MGRDISLFGSDLFGEKVIQGSGPLKQRFVAPPFSVLDARQGEWQERKRAWIRMGIKSEVGRGNVQSSLASARDVQKGGNKEAVSIHVAFDHARGKAGTQKRAEYNAKRAAPGRSPMPACDYSGGERGGAAGKPIPGSKTKAAALADVKLKKLKGFKVGVDPEQQGEDGDPEAWVVSSIFDPVLCELAYRWWCPDGGQIIDPFAGGSVRGIVAGALGRRYWGCDLRPEQVDANYEQKELILPDAPIEWVCGDSMIMVPESAPDADFVFSCPPYGDLEVYSNEPDDLSNMSFGEFVVAYKKIIKHACDRLKQDRFACFVVADFRDEKGNYRNFVSGTIRAFKEAGLHLYNELVLVTMVGTASVRANRQFNAGRKVVKSHQNVLVFVKGDGKKAAQAMKEEKL